MDKAKLLAGRRETAEVEVEGVGTFTVRALSRAEVLAFKRDGMTLAEVEALMLSMALVDPELTVNEATTWQQNATATEVGAVVDVITKLSGLEVRADKAALKSPAQ